MYLATIEVRRAIVRYAIVALSVGLVLFLILAQQGLQTSLVRSISGGLENQSAEVLVFSVDAQRSPVASFIDPDLEAALAGLDGVAEVEGWRQSYATVEYGGATTEVALVGFAADGPGAPNAVDGEQPDAVGEVVISEPTARPSFSIGERLQFGTEGASLSVTGIAADAAIGQLPTVWMTNETYLEVFSHLHPGASQPPVNVLAVRPLPGVSPAELVVAIDALDDELEALTREDAAAGLPQVEQIEQGFSTILLLFGLVLPAIVGLFFMITTLQKARPLILLRALGVPRARLAAVVIVQVGMVAAAGVALGIGLFLPLTAVGIGGLPIAFDPSAAVTWSGAVFALSLFSTSFAVRRVLRIDPIEATTGGGVGA